MVLVGHRVDAHAATLLGAGWAAVFAAPSVDAELTFLAPRKTGSAMGRIRASVDADVATSIGRVALACGLTLPTTAKLVVGTCAFAISAMVSVCRRVDTRRTACERVSSGTRVRAGALGTNGTVDALDAA